jgi:hypothetical protein
MNEFSTYEFVVSQKIEGAWRAARIGMIALYVCFVLGCLLLGISFNVLPPLALVPVFTWILIFCTWRYVAVDYEYSITSGELTFSKIFGNRSRRTQLKLMLRDAVRIAPLDDEAEAAKAAAFRPVREFWAISSQNATDVYFMLFEYGKDKEHAVFYFEATQKALQICRFYNPSATLVTKVSR